MTADPPASDPLEELVAECLRRRSLEGVMPLDELCRQHPQHAETLRERVQQIERLNLARHESRPVPEQVGPFRILDVLGEGGMGTVYLAEQKVPVRRRVALKVIKLGMDTKAVLARFGAEQQALAMMEHHHIARVFSAGTTDSGQPYFVMEYVKGVAITDYCDKNRLSTRERIRLFQQVCDAVQHAHHKGVIHRDLKPSNILVTDHEGPPEIKIIDFGLARATDHQLVQATVYTEHGQLIGTPEYMSPEQAELSSAEIDTRTDVYSLGVLLYELLVGALPFSAGQLRRAGLLELRRCICNFEPPRPSKRLSGLGAGSGAVAQLRQTTPPVLLKELRGDLDWVVMRALEKNRGRRYQSPRELGREVARFLASEPVLAGPPGLAYRLAKFVRRRRGALVAAAGSMLALAGGYLIARMSAANETSGVAAKPAAGPTPAAELLGSTGAEVVRRLGPPEAVSAGSAMQLWSYRSVDGRLVAQALTLQRGIVVSFDPAAGVLRRRPVPDRGPYLGQTAAELVTDIGPPAQVMQGTQTSSFEYGDFSLTIADGMVIGIAGDVSAITRVQPAVDLPATAPSRFLGVSAQQVIEALGPPLGIGGGPTQTWCYETVGGQRVEEALYLQDGAVVDCSREPTALKKRAIPSNGPYLGQPIRELIGQVGPERELVRGPSGMVEYRFATFTADVVDGLVVHLR